VTENKQRRKIKKWHVILVLLTVLLVVGGYVGYRSYLIPYRFGELIEGEVYHSAQPTGWQWSILKRKGIKRVINFRARIEDSDEDTRIFDEEVRICKEAGIDWVNIPVESTLPSDDQIEQFIRAIFTRPGPVLFHCQHGRHRTSFMKVAYRILMDEWSVDDALDEMENMLARPEGEKLEKAIKIFERIQNNRQDWLKAVNSDQ